MKKDHQINKAQAQEAFEAWAKDNPQKVQLSFATDEIVAYAQQGLGELIRQMGKQFIEHHQ